MGLLAAAASAVIHGRGGRGGEELNNDNFDEEEIRAWREFLFRSDTDILILSRKAELVVSIFAICCVAILHGSMIFYSNSVTAYQQEATEAVTKQQQQQNRRLNYRNQTKNNRSSKKLDTNSSPVSPFWNFVLLRCWYYANHCSAATFYLLPLLTLLSYSPNLWMFMLFLLLGVMYHQRRMVPPSSSSSTSNSVSNQATYNSETGNRKRRQARQKQPPIVATVIATPIKPSSSTSTK